MKKQIILLMSRNPQEASPVAIASWSAPALWRFPTGNVSVQKRQWTAAVQNLAAFWSVHETF
jgi:hypothetical protein